MSKKSWCSVCGKDLCSKCTNFVDNGGDYDDRYCDDCLEIKNTYEDKISTLEDEIDKLYGEMEKECLKRDRTK